MCRLKETYKYEQYSQKKRNRKAIYKILAYIWHFSKKA